MRSVAKTSKHMGDHKTRQKKRNRMPKRSREETTCSTKNHGRLARHGKSRGKRAARNWKRGSTERMQRFIPRDGLLPGKKYRQDDRRQARNGVKTEIFEKVPDAEAITCCSPPKPLFTDVKNAE